VVGAARRLGFPQSTIYYRMKMLEEKCHFEFEPQLTWSKMGLKRISTIVYPHVKSHDIVLSKLKSIRYFEKFYRLMTPNLGFLFVWRIPENSAGQMRRFLEAMKQESLIKEFTFHLVGEQHVCGPSFEWYDPSTKAWAYRWSDVHKRLTESLPIELEDPGNYFNVCDKLDIFIVERIQMKPKITFSEIAKAAGVSVPTVKYRYGKLERAGVLRGHYPGILAFPPEASRLLDLRVEFPSGRELGTFAAGLKGLPFALAYQKEVGLNNLIVRVYLPSSELAPLLDLLTNLTHKDFIKDFSFFELDIRTAEKYSIESDLFVDGQWKFDVPPVAAVPTNWVSK
jgi:DNA-binding Lrp family transcriptional regulator